MGAGDPPGAPRGRDSWTGGRAGSDPGQSVLALALIYAELPHEDAIPSEDKERRELTSLLGRAIRSPSQFEWGQMVHDSLRERLRALFGTEVIPPTWPEKPPPRPAPA